LACQAPRLRHFDRLRRFETQAEYDEMGIAALTQSFACSRHYRLKHDPGGT
jgi:hypothetical protein